MTQDYPPATGTIMIDNDRVRVTEWRFGPGQATGHHRHEMDYVVVPITTGRLKILDKDGAESYAGLVEGEPYYRPAGVEHDVINDDDREIAFIEIEIR